MNSFKKLLACLMLGLVVLTWSCKKDDDDPVGCNYLSEVEDEINAFNAAVDVYTNNPTTENCNAFKAAYQDYLNALEDNVECAALSGQQAELQAAIDAAQAELNSFQC